MASNSDDFVSVELTDVASAENQWFVPRIVGRFWNILRAITGAPWQVFIKLVSKRQTNFAIKRSEVVNKSALEKYEQLELRVKALEDKIKANENLICKSLPAQINDKPCDDKINTLCKLAPKRKPSELVTTPIKATRRLNQLTTGYGSAPEDSKESPSGAKVIPSPMARQINKSPSMIKLPVKKIKQDLTTVVPSRKLNVNHISGRIGRKSIRDSNRPKKQKSGESCTSRSISESKRRANDNILSCPAKEKSNAQRASPKSADLSDKENRVL